MIYARKDLDGYKEDNSDAHTHIILDKDDYNSLIREKNNLIRVHRERSNSARDLRPKKEHTGYVLISGMEGQTKQFGYTFKCYKYKFQTPYDIILSFEDAKKYISSDIKQFDNFLLLDNREHNYRKFSVYLDFSEFDSEEFDDIWENELIFFDLKIKQNGFKQYWEVEFSSTIEINLKTSILGKK